MVEKFSKKEIISEDIVKKKDEKNKGLASVFLLLLLLFSILIYDYYNQVDATKPIIVGKNNNSLGNDSNLNGVKIVSNEDELKLLLRELSLNENKDFYYNSNLVKTRGDMMFDSIATTQNLAVEKSSEQNNDLGLEYSQTNNNDENVDEADIIKTNGKYIYTLSQNKIVIIEAFPIENSKVIETIKFDEENNIQNFFINQDKIIVFSNSYDKEMKVSEYSFIPEEFYVSKSNVEIFEFDGEKVNSVEKISTSGNYYDARMIGDYIYFISKEYSYSNDVIPYLYKDDMKIMPNVYYFDINYYNSKVYNTITSINLNDLKEVNSESFLLENSQNLYVSENNIYISGNKYYDYRDTRKEFFEEELFNILDLKVQEKILKLDSNSKDYFDEIQKILTNMYNLMDEKSRKDFIFNVEKLQDDFTLKKEEERSKSTIYKISIDKGKIELKAQGEVKGTLLNEFSLNEDNNYLRVATNINLWSKNENKVSNNVYILDDNLNVISGIENLAKGERIYSTRFIGDKLYMVTFKQIDPLFVIDLSNVSEPKVLGELKIPGYSTYLHPYDENYLIGLGFETKESEFGGIVNNGVKLSLFDISDFNNPKEVDNYIIGEKWTTSIATDEHKAFLFDKKRNLLVIPVREFTGDYESYVNYKFSQKVFVFNIDENGFELKGKISHGENQEERYSYYSANQIKRSLFIEDILYTISEEKVLANDLNSLEKLEEFDLGYEKKDYKRLQIYY